MMEYHSLVCYIQEFRTMVSHRKEFHNSREEMHKMALDKNSR